MVNFDVFLLLFFRPDFFKKEKKRACGILMLFSTDFLFKMKLWIKQNNFDAQSKPDVLKMFLW